MENYYSVMGRSARNMHQSMLSIFRDFGKGAAFLLFLIFIFSGNVKVNAQNTCAAPQIIASLPYTLASGTTCGTVNNYTTTIGGSTLYVSGEDRIFRFTPAATGPITISVTQPAGAYLGMYLYTGCPFTAYVGGVQNNTANKSFTVTVTSGVTYYLMLDTWAAPTCTAFTNLNITAPASCVTPTGLTSSNIASTTATISWAAAVPAPASGYQYYVSTSATAPTGATVPTGSTAAGVLTANLTGLTANTTYYFWVRGNCGGAGTSAWSAVGSFYTGTCLPSGTSAYTINSVITSGGITNISNATAGNGGYGNFTAQSASNSIGTPTTLTVTHSATGGGAGVGVWINWNNDLDFADANEQIAITTGWNYSPFTATINIPAGTPVGNYRMRIVLDYNAIAPVSCPVAISGESEDYTFTVTTPPSCAVPTTLASSAITATTATISWAAASPAPASGYQYYVSTVNTAPTGATVPTGSTAAGVLTANLTGLTANTTYYFWVRSNCGGSGTSPWAGVSSFYTGYCTPSAISVDNQGITNVSFGNGPTVNNTTGAEANNYGNYSAQIGGLYQGQLGTVAITFNTLTYDYNTIIWVDWNNDLDFADAGEQVYSGLSSATSPNTLNASFTVPGTATIGANYRMRIGAGDAAAPSYCTTGASYTCFEDYTISILAPCVPSGNPTVYGTNAWIGYVYQSAAAGQFTTYNGFVTEATTFNRTHTSATGATTNICIANQDFFAIRYLNTSNLPAGYYTFSVGGDDGVRFSIDGGTTWLINNWVDQGYTVSSNPTPVFLSGNTNMVFEYYENGGGAQSSFSYIFTPACSGTPTPGNTLASATSVVSGGTTNLSLQNSTAPASYQWQSSSSSSGPWTDIAGATNATYTATVSANTWYQCVVTCTASSLFAASSPVQITMLSAINVPATGSNTVNCGSNTIVYDNGGAAGVYSVSMDGTTVLDNSGTGVITLSGTYSGLETCCDYFQIYAGVGTAGTLLAQYGALGSGTITTITSAPGQALTIRFYSDVSITGAGFALTANYSGTCSSCSAMPSAIVASGSSSTTASVSWTAASPAPASGYQYFVSTVNIAPTGASTPTGTTAAGVTSVNLTGLTANTTYYVWVRSNCGTETSSWAGSASFFTGYCNPGYTYGTVDGDLISNVVIATTTLSNNTGTTAGLSSYNFYTGQPNYTANMVAANSYNVSVTAGSFTNQNFAAWIDYNDNNVFEASEKIGFSSAATTAAFQTVNFAVNLSCTPPLGTHRMRIRGVYATAGSTIDPCLTYGWGETEDYMITIVAGAPFTPAFTATPLTPNCVGAQVTYTAAAGQTNYAWTFPGTAGVDYTLVSGGTSTSNTAVVTYNTSGSNTITMNYASPLGCASSGAINNTITVGAGTFTTTAAAGDVIWRGATSTDWSTASNWYAYNGTSYAVASGVPSAATRTIIPANNTCVLAQPSVNITTAGSAKDVIIETGATLTMTTGTLNVSGNFVNNGTFVAGTGKVAFNAAGTVSGNATTFNDVDLNNGVNFGSSLSTVNGIMTMNTGSWVNTNAPIYGTSSLLKYNTGGTYGRGFEWSTTSGAGYPNDVQVSNNTTINYPNTGGAFSTNLGIRRDLTIDAGSNLYMDYGTGNASGSLTVGRNVTSAGDLSLGNQIGGDIYVGGNWTRTTGNLYANNRAVFFNGATGNQTITKTGGESFPYMVVNKASGNVILANNVTTTGGLTLTSGLVEVGTNNLVMGASTLSGGSATSYVKTASTGILSRNVGASAATFPVGNSTYNPAILTNNGTGDIFSARVIDNVTADGTGVGATTTEAVVKRTWMIEESVTGGTDATLRLYWNGAGEEINGFSAGTAFMAHYVAAASLWDNIGGTVGAGYVETSNNTSFSPYTISSSTTFAPLPVELISLGAQCANDNVIVSWSTASEHNTLNYVVERSADGMSWNEVQTVAAAVNSNTVLDYAIEDAGAARGLKYYRLIQTDQDGVQKIYGPVMANCGSDDDIFMSFPNPSDADITLVFNSKNINGSTTLMVRDAHGRVVRSMALEIQPGTDSILVPDMELTPGVYYLQLEGESFKTPVIKHSLR